MGFPRRCLVPNDARGVFPRLAGLLLLWLPLLPAPAFAAAAAAGKWTAVQGRVDVTRVGAGAPRPARPGDAVAVGDLLAAGSGARAQALLADDTVVNLSPGAAIRILQYAFDPASGRRTAVVKVLDGRARFIVAARKNSRFSVESPQAAIAAAAADFVARVSPDETIVVVLDGSARVKNVSNLIVAEVELRANQSTGVTRKTAPSHPAQITTQQRKEYRDDARLVH
jgi:ferric-dicitrate binding protein FerR (iron transport regulator)